MVQITELLKCEKEIIKFKTFYCGILNKSIPAKEKENFIYELISKSNSLNTDALINEIYNNYTNSKNSPEIIHNYTIVKIHSLLDFCNESLEEIELESKNIENEILECVNMARNQIMIVQTSINFTLYELKKYIVNTEEIKSEDEIIEDLKSKKESSFLRTTHKEKFVYLKELGLLEMPMFKNSTSLKKETYLSKILDCHIDYARDLIKYNEHKYSDDKKNGIKEEIVSKVKEQLK